MTRKEAIEYINNMWMSGETHDALEVLIPELKESEDERIRKALIEYHKQQFENNRDQEVGLFHKDALAYLEKQKENPKSADSIPSDCTSDAKCEDRDSNYGVFPEDVIVVARACEKLKAHGYTELAHALKNVNLYTKEQKPVDYDHEMWKNCVANFEGGKKEVIEHPEKYGLQKPAEWSEDWREEDIQTRFAFYTYKNEEDDGVLYLSNVFVEEASRNHGFGTRILRAAEKVAETIGATTISLKVKQDSPANAWYRKNGYGYVAFEDGYDWLEKNLEYMKPNKQEWSEEDERMLSRCIKSVECSKQFADSETYKAAKDVEMNWLEFLPKRKNLPPKQEWSEKDKKTINDACCFLSEYAGYIGSGNWGKSSTLFIIVDKLKSLYPSWKPSKKQMDALKNIAYGAYQNGDGPALRELHEQLDKLCKKDEKI